MERAADPQPLAERIKAAIAASQSRAAEAREEVSAAIAARAKALEERQRELVAEIDRLAKEKVQGLQKQLKEVEAGTWEPPPALDPDREEPEHGDFLLCADAVITFKLGEEDFLEKIPKFGIIGDKRTYSSRSYAKGPGLGILKAGCPTYLWVIACDREGRRREDGGDSVVATLSAPEAFEGVETTDRKDGRYRVSLTPLEAGSFALDLAVGPQGAAEPIQGSPFRVEVAPATEHRRLGAEQEAEGKARIGESSDGLLHEFGAVHHPSGIDFDHTGRYYFVADQSNHRIQAFRAEDHRPLAVFGKKGQGSSDFDTPCDIVAESPWCFAGRINRIVVSDLLNHRLQLLEFDEKAVEFRHVRSIGGRGDAEGQFQFPKGMALTDHGELLVCDSGNHRVQVFNMLDDVAFVRQIGQHGVGTGQLTFPLDAAVNCHDEILVSDSCHRIQVFNVDGTFLRTFGQKGRERGTPPLFNQPTNMCVSDENSLFVCDQANHRVQVLDACTGAPVHKWGGARRRPGEGEEEPPDEEGEDGEKAVERAGLSAPGGIAVNTRGMVLVSDYLKNVIYAF